jgi:hypothetical protein
MKRELICKEQNKSKPAIEDVIPDYLCGDIKKNALDFCEYLRANKIKPVWAGANTWKAIYKNKPICYIRLFNDDWNKLPRAAMYGGHSWVVTLYIERNMHRYEDVILKEGLQNFIWDNVHYCMLCRSPCHGHTPPHRDTVAFGKEIKRICHGRELTWVFDPDEQAVNRIKRLLELEKQARDSLL